MFYKWVIIGAGMVRLQWEGGGGGGGQEHVLAPDEYRYYLCGLSIPMGHHSAQVRSPANVHSMAMY